MAFHRDYPVRTYQSLMKDLETPKPKPRRYVPPKEPEVPKGPEAFWMATYKILMRLTLEELREMAEEEGVDMGTVVRKDSKGQLVNAIIRVRKQKAE